MPALQENVQTPVIELAIGVGKSHYKRASAHLGGASADAAKKAEGKRSLELRN
jgi:hypothetical protein